MKRAIAVVMTIGVLMTPVGLSQGQDGGRILFTGYFHGDEVSAIHGDEWYGLFKTGDAFELRATRIGVEIVEDPIMDAEGEKTGKRVTVTGDEEPIFLVNGLSTLKEGSAPTAFQGAEFLFPAQSELLELGKKWFQLTAYGSVEEMYDEAVIKNYSIQLRTQDGEKQTIVRIEFLSMDGGPTLIWAGDIDGDGELDLLFDLTDHYNVTDYALYLSSAAEDGEVVGLAATLTLTGC